MATLAEPIVHGKLVESELKTNTLTLFDTTVIATSSVAPAYTLAATMGFLVAAVGLASPAAILVGFLPVLCIAIAYYYLNRQDPNCGASYSWVSRTLSPHIGWISGWIQLAANVLFCAAAPLVAGAYTLQLLNSLFPNLVSATTVNDNRWIAVVGGSLAGPCHIHGRPRHSHHRQLSVDPRVHRVLDRSCFCAVGDREDHRRSPRPGAACRVVVQPGRLGGLSGVVTGSALAVFFFWGWDTAANVNEESKDANESPGLAGIYSMFILLFIFLLAAIAMQTFLGSAAIRSEQSVRRSLLFRNRFPARRSPTSWFWPCSPPQSPPRRRRCCPPAG